MKAKIFFALSILACLSTKAQNSFSFSIGASSNPENLVDNEAYLNMEGNLTTVEYKSPAIPQFGLSYTINKPQSNWSWDLGLAYRYIEVHSTVHHDSADTYGFFIYQPWDEEYIASLNYVSISAGGSYSIPFNQGNSKLTIPLGVEILLPFSCKTLQDLGNDTYLFRRIFQGEDYSSGIYYGLYLRPTYSFNLTKNQNSPWNFGIYADAQLLFLNQPKRNPSFLGGGGLQVRYQISK